MQIQVPEERAGQARRLVELVAREPFHKRSWAELAYFLASSALAYTAALVLAVLGVTGLALTVVVVGIVIIAGTLRDLDLHSALLGAALAQASRLMNSAAPAARAITAYTAISAKPTGADSGRTIPP